MKIAYIGSFSRLWDEEGIARSFEALGHEVKRFNERGFASASIDKVIDYDPDMLVFAKLKTSYPVRQELMERYKGKSTCFIPDLYWGLSRQFLIKHNDPMFQADYVFTPDGGNDDKWDKEGINHHLVRQGIYDKELGAMKEEKKYDLTFVGAINTQFPYRKTLLANLGNRFNLNWVGNRRDDEFRGEELTKLIAQSKIIIGDSVDSPYYWSNRIYETIGRGGFIIHPNIKGLDKDYEPYKHFVPYEWGDFHGLYKKIEYYLKHDEERNKIAMAGMKHTKDNHTLLNRCKQMVEIWQKEM